MNEHSRSYRLTLGLLRLFCPAHLLEEIEGDLLQKFERDLNTFGEGKAKRRMLWNTIRYCRPGIVMRNRFSFEIIQLLMIKNYVTVLLRSLSRRKFYAFINVLCLTIGIAFALLIGLFVASELQVNKSLKDVSQLFLMESKEKASGDVFPFTPGILPKQAIDRYPVSFQNYYRFWDRNITVSKSDKHFRLQSMIGDSTFIDIFGFKVLDGDGKNALTKPNSIVITRKTALQFFNTVDVAGESLTVSTEQNGKKEYLITAVIENTEKKNSVTDFMNMDAQVFLSLENAADFFPQADPDSWQNLIITYIKLSSSQSHEAEVILNNLVSKEGPKDFSDLHTISLNPIQDYYRTTDHGAVHKMILSLVVIIAFILILAVSNFINITIASSFSRSKEVGVRKVIGGLQQQVMMQFLLESIILAVFSGVMALLLYEGSHTYMALLIESDLPSLTEINLNQWVAIFSLIVAIGFVAGIYPAIFQSLAKPIDSLKGKFKSVRGTIRFSRSLVGVQFLITILIFVGAVILSKQTSYFISKDLGYDKSHVLVVSSVPRLWNEAGFQKMESAKNEFLQSSKVKSVSLSWGAPGWNFSPGGGKVYKLGTPAEKGVEHVITSADEDFQKVFGLRMIEGSFMNEGTAHQPLEVVINASAQKALDVHVGDRFKAKGYGDTLFTVKGIVQDFNFSSLHEKIGPLMMMHTKDYQAYRYFNFRFQPGTPGESIRELERLWKISFPDEPLSYSFADEKLKSLYTTELRMQKAAALATFLMMVIVVIGVIGLVSLNLSKKVKEIGVRKVLGASLGDILFLMAKEYAILMAVAFSIGATLIYFLSEYWLKSFAYRIDLSWWMFGLPSASLFLLILLIVAAQSLKTALSNPVSSLRHE